MAKRGGPNDLVWALQYIITNHTYDTRHRTTSRPDDPGWHYCRCGQWEGYWSGYNTHVAEDQLKMLTATGLLDKAGAWDEAARMANDFIRIDDGIEETELIAANPYRKSS